MSKIIGPAKPPNLCEDSENSDSDGDYGPALPPNWSDNEKVSTAIKTVNDTNDDDGEKVNEIEYDPLKGATSSEKGGLSNREEWMVECPENRATSVGMKSVKHFSQRSTQPYVPVTVVSEEDKMIAAAVEEYNKEKRPLSLLEMHQREGSHKKQKKETHKMEREPLSFDPNEKTVKMMSKQQASSVIQKARQLNTRFASGSKKFL